jgi:hypothetical protein
MGSSQSNSQHQKRGSASTTTKITKTNTSVTKSSSAYNSNFQQKLIDSGVYPYGYKYLDDQRPSLPENWKEINERLAQPRSSLSLSAFSDEKYEEFVQADAEAFNEDAVKELVLPVILKAIAASRGAQKKALFTNIPPITDNIA